MPQKGSAEHEAQLQVANISEFVQLTDNPEVTTSTTIVPRAMRTMNCLSYEDIWSMISDWTFVKLGCGWENSCREQYTARFPNLSTSVLALIKAVLWWCKKVLVVISYSGNQNKPERIQENVGRSAVNPWIINFSFFFIFKYSLLFIFPSLPTTRSWGLYKRETELTKCNSTGLSFHTQSFWESELPSQKFEINTSQRSKVSKYCYGQWVICRAPVVHQRNRNSTLFQPEKFDPTQGDAQH